MVSTEPSSESRGANLLGCAFALLYFGLGFVQMLAIIAGLQLWFGMHWVLALVISGFTAYIPIVGIAAGVWGATTAWGWSVWSAIALFAGPILLFLTLMIIAGVGGGIAGLTGRIRSKASRP